jgi:mannosyltransferase
VYAGCLAFLLPKLSLWLDEILTLIGALKPDLPSLFSYLRSTPGATPLAFLVPAWTIDVLGYSLFSARVSSLLFSVAACVAIFLLARRLKLRAPLLAVLVFALCPLQFRYAVEARPYAMALCISAWSTVIFLSLRDHPRSWVRGLLYGLLTVTGAFTVAFTLFVPAAHAIWSTRHESRRLLAICAASIAAAGLALIPWYAYVREGWNTGIAVQRLGSVINWGSVSVILHELTGMGYGGTVFLLAVAGWGASRVTHLRGFWISYVLLPALFVLLGDIAFRYFLAVRQMIFILAPLALLFVAGAEAVGRWGKLLVLAFLVAAIYEDVKWVSKPREDWHAAATVAAEQIRDGACLRFVPVDAEMLYVFFRHELAERKCTPDQFAKADSVALVINPYNSGEVAKPRTNSRHAA